MRGEGERKVKTSTECRRGMRYKRVEGERRGKTCKTDSMGHTGKRGGLGQGAANNRRGKRGKSKATTPGVQSDHGAENTTSALTTVTAITP
jgi:hypothetical protein